MMIAEIDWIAAAIQSISAIIIAVPLLALLLRRRLSDSRLGSLVALALSSWVVVLWRNDVAHVLAAFHSTLIVAVCLLGALREVRWSTVAIGVALLVAVMIPVGAERLWLLVNTSRPSLVHWDRDTAGILMERSRHVTIERILATMDAGLESPTAAWPAQPGLIFLSGRPLATRQVTLLAGSVRDESAVIADLRDRDPERLILGRVAGLAPGARSLDELTPTVWTHLRVNYLVELQLADGFEGFQVIRKAADSTVDLEDIPLGQRLPGTSQLVKNAQTPPLKPGVIVSQEFRVGGLDLRGVALLVAVTGPLPTEVDVQIGIEAAHSEEPARSLAVFRSRVPLDQHVQLRTLEFPAVAGSAGRLVVLNVSVVPGPEHEVRLLWHDQRQDKGSQVDYYQDGTASLNGTPVDADLFFVSY